MKEIITGENGELFYEAEFFMENLYYILYYSFVDANNQHFLWRQNPMLELKTSEEVGYLCIRLIKQIAEVKGMTALEFLDSYEYPQEVQKAVETVREALLHPESFGETLTATCSVCGKSEDYKMDMDETEKLMLYREYGRAMGYIQDLFPKVPAWIRSGAIDQLSGGFCLCPACCEA